MDNHPPRIMPQPEQELLSWCPAYAGEPRKRQPYMNIWIWVPREIARDIRALAEYLHANAGFMVARTVGWSSGGISEDGALACAGVTVSSRQVREKLARAADQTDAARADPGRVILDWKRGS